ncbi:MAG: ATP-binding protein [Pseudomonadota bacterium]
MLTPVAPASRAAALPLPAAEERRRFIYFLRSVVLSVLALGVGFLWAGFVAPGIANIVLGAGFAAILAWGLSGRGRQLPGTHLTLVWGLLAMLVNAALTGGQASYALWFLALLPLLSAFIGGRAVAWGWAAIAMAAAALVWALQQSGRLPVSGDATLPASMLLLAHLVLIFMAATFAGAARHASERHIQLLGEKLAAERAAHDHAETARQMEEQARHSAEAASHSKSRFLATMSHEMRTPLNAVIGFNNLLLDLDLSPRERQLAELAQQSGESLLQLINDILDLSKIEAGHLELEPLVFDPRVVVREALAMVERQAAAKGLTLECEVTAPGGLRGDPSRLRQILVNLLGNAVKFTDAGRVVLRCWPVTGEGGAEWLRFEVTDTGIGIDEASQAHLFQPFTQADASTTRRFGGTGLGLAICRELASLMGGSISLASAPGAGATFRVELPFAPVPEAAWPSPSAATAALPAATARRCRVLLAEDNAVNQIMAREMLKRLGCQVDVVGNGREAIEAWQRLPYDLVFMDCDMPEMDGFAACREIRRQEGGQQHVPVIAITAAAIAGDRDKCLAAGMDDYLAKPVRLHEMQAVLERNLSRLRDPVA